jgi:putative membrane protein
MSATPHWLLVKIIFVLLLYAYHFSLHIIYREQRRGVFRFSSQQLRIWNELATLLLFAIVFLAAVKQGMSAAYGLAGIALLAVMLMLAIRIYKRVRG